VAELISIVDGKAERSRLIRDTLERAGYSVQLFTTGHQFTSSFGETPPSLILIAVSLPDGSGVELYRQIQSSIWGRASVIFLADTDLPAADTVSLKVAGDCITAPFIASELLSRVEFVLSQLSPISAREADIVIDSSAMKLKVAGKEIPTTTLEFRLIEYMARHRGKVFTRDALLDAVWGDLQFVTPRTVDACVGRIRRKLECGRSSSSSYLKTIRGIGYKLEATTGWESAPSEFCHCVSCSMARTHPKGPRGHPGRPSV